MGHCLLLAGGGGGLKILINGIKKRFKKATSYKS